LNEFSDFLTGVFYYTVKRDWKDGQKINYQDRFETETTDYAPPGGFVPGYPDDPK
jgi:hypothetical protein